MANDLSTTMRDYLAEIYRLSERTDPPNGYVSTSALAELMDVSAPAVNRMVTKLKELDLLNHEPYQGIHLTKKGEHEALFKLRKHRIAEVFLVNVMGFSWNEVYDEAHRMSNGMTEAITKRMLEMAGNPAFCPHGEPIPYEDGSIDEPDDVLLIHAPVNIDLTLTRVLTREPDRLEYIAALGLVPGAHLQLIHIAPFNGPMQLKLNNEYRIIGHNLAEFIRVSHDNDQST